ncbi:MAG: hypothetical protein HYY05_05285 [Chloroflexi bacterium]|nr:hypothetical protein [Chloroflexota bacterium]
MGEKLLPILEEQIEQYLRALEFCDWARVPSDLESLADLGRSALLSYQEHLLLRASERTRERGKRRVLAAATRNRHQATLGSFFRFLVDREQLLVDPTLRLKDAREQRKLATVLTVGEVYRLLGGIDIGPPAGLRDRAAVELLYGAGLCGGRVSASSDELHPADQPGARGRS